MASSFVTQLKRDAKQAGINWNDVIECKNDLVSQSLYANEREQEVRKIAWHTYVGSSSGSAPFWRHGFSKRFAKKLAKGADYTCIPGYDEIALAVSSEWPEFANDDDSCDGTARLFDFLFQPYKRLPSRDELYAQAFDLVASATPIEELAEIPF